MITLDTPAGTKVRLIDAKGWRIPDASVKMEVGDVFTIREVSDEFEELAIALDERRDMSDPEFEPLFAARRFEVVKCVLDDMLETMRLCDLNEEDYAHFDRGLNQYSGCTLCRASDEDPVSEADEGGEDEWRLRSCESTALLAVFSPINTIGEVWKSAEQLTR